MCSTSYRLALITLKKYKIKYLGIHISVIIWCVQHIKLHISGEKKNCFLHVRIAGQRLWVMTMEAEECSRKSREILKLNNSLIDIVVFSWSLKDILNEELYKHQVSLSLSHCFCLYCFHFNSCFLWPFYRLTSDNNPCKYIIVHLWLLDFFFLLLQKNKSNHACRSSNVF